MGSCDVFGHPYEVAIIFDILTKKETATHQVHFRNAIHLLNDYLNSTKTNNKDNTNETTSETENNLPFAYKIVSKQVKNEISHDEKSRIFQNHNINEDNAIEYYNSQRLKGNPESHQKNVYELLSSYIERNPDTDYFIDEVPILMSRKSMFNHLNILLNTKNINLFFMEIT